MLLYMHIFLLQITKKDIMNDVGVQTKYERHEDEKMMKELSFLGELSHQQISLYASCPNENQKHVLRHATRLTLSLVSPSSLRSLIYPNQQ